VKAQPNLAAQLSLAGLKIKIASLDPSGRPVPDPTRPGLKRVSRVRVISGFGLKNRVHNPKISGGFGSGLRVGSNFARSNHHPPASSSARIISARTTRLLSRRYVGSKGPTGPPFFPHIMAFFSQRFVLLIALSHLAFLVSYMKVVTFDYFIPLCSWSCVNESCNL